MSSMAWQNPGFARLLARIGDASYSLYLLHWFVLSFLGKIGGHFSNASTLHIILWHIVAVLF